MKNKLIKIQFRDNNNTLDYIVVFLNRVITCLLYTSDAADE